MKNKLAIFILFLFLGTVNVALALNDYVASSTNYRIVEDSISSGGLLSTSTNYIIQSTLPAYSADTSTSTSFSIKSGALPMATSYLAVSAPGNVAMSPAINTSGGGTGLGQTSWSVTTDSSGGYSISIKASTNPALKSSTDSFANYQTRAAGIPDFNFTEGDGVDAFGFTPEGSDIASAYKDDGVSACGGGANDTADKCWDSISTADKTVAKGSANNPTGAVTTIKFRAEAGRSVNKKAGSYSATITATVLAL